MTSTDLFRYSPGGTGGQEDESDWSNEDTDEASEDYDDSPKRIGNSTAVKRPYTEIKEQMYQVFSCFSCIGFDLFGVLRSHRRLQK
jgi:hypothetical protein